MCCRYPVFVIIVLLTDVLFGAQMSSPVIAGELTTPAPTEKATKRDTLVTGLRVSNEFDDNAMSYSQKKQSNILTLIEPHIGWSLSHSRANWTFDYRPGFSLSHEVSAYDSRSQALDTSLELTLTHRLSARLRESFLQTKNPFDLAPESGSLLGSSVLDHPHAPLATTARARSEQSGVDLFYALDSHTVLAVGGAFFRVGYDSPEQNRVLASTQSASAHAVYSHRLSRQHWIGVEYNLQDLISNQPQSHALVHGVFYTDTTQIRPSMSLTFFAGPERLIKRDQLTIPSQETPGISNASWQWAGGISYAWTGARTRLTAGFSRRVSDGGGLQGVVRESGLTAEAHRQLARQWKGDVLIAYNHNTELAGAVAPLSYLSVASGVSRELTPRLSFGFRYWRVHEYTVGAIPRLYFADHNRVSVSLIYDLKTPIAR
jgi:hypothetical protein